MKNAQGIFWEARAWPQHIFKNLRVGSGSKSWAMVSFKSVMLFIFFRAFFLFRDCSTAMLLFHRSFDNNGTRRKFFCPSICWPSIFHFETFLWRIVAKNWNEKRFKQWMGQVSARKSLNRLQFTSGKQACMYEFELDASLL